jgi:hypothetical protein
MKARLLTWLATTLLACLVFAADANVAHARRGLAIINTGEDIFPTGPLPQPYDTVPELAGFQAGYRCSIFGVFWMYATWWDCKAVAVNAENDSYIDEPELVAAISAKYTENDVQVGFWKGTMRWILLGLVLAVGALIAWGAITGSGNETDAEANKEKSPDDSPEKAQADTGGA